MNEFFSLSLDSLQSVPRGLSHPFDGILGQFLQIRNGGFGCGTDPSQSQARLAANLPLGIVQSLLQGGHSFLSVRTNLFQS
jgi:hypothetical protein